MWLLPVPREQGQHMMTQHNTTRTQKQRTAHGHWTLGQQQERGRTRRSRETLEKSKETHEDARRRTTRHGTDRENHKDTIATSTTTTTTTYNLLPTTHCTTTCTTTHQRPTDCQLPTANCQRPPDLATNRPTHQPTYIAT